jgi:hypothetical protein
MKSNFYIFLSFICFVLLTGSCKKQEPFYPDAEQPRVVALAINGSTTEDLEFVYKDSVIATGIADNGKKFVFNTKLNIGSQKAELKIRKKASGEILETRAIQPSPFSQTVNVFYDGTSVFNSSVSYRIKGYAASGELEFLLDGNVIASGTAKIDNIITFGIDENTPREIKVRLKGETTTLLTKTINALPAEQSLKFFFDGTSIADNVQLNPPVNPNNMAITAQFKTAIPDMFLGGQVDLVFYVYNNKTDVYSKPNPEVRFTMPADGSFTSFELPSLPNATDYEYRIVIYKKGTHDVPYDASSSGFPIILENNGRFSGQIIFEPGKSKIWLIDDFWSLDTTPDFELASVFGVGINDLSQYFQ